MSKEELLNKLEAATTTEELEAIKAEIRSLQEEKVEEPKEEVKEEATEQVAEEVKEEVAKEVVEEPKEEPVMTDSEERSLLAGNENLKENIEARNVLRGEEKMEENKINSVLEQRGADLKAGKKVIVNAEERSMNVAGGTILVPKKYSNNLQESFEAVSGMVDKANSIQLNGGESYSVAFEKSYDAGDYKAESAAYANIDIDVDYVETGRAKITAYTEITKEARKLPDIAYDALVVKRVRDAIRKKLGGQMIIGAGTTNTIKGIYNADQKVLTGGADISIASINADTLNTLVFALGGNESVEAPAELIINKKDVEAFAKVKTTDGKFVYKVTRNGQTGTISYADGGLEVPYVINSACRSIGDASTNTNDFTMVYGSLANYELPVFSDLEVAYSSDYKFKEGIDAYRAEVIVGGTVNKYEGFVRVKKAASV